jgi:hypothetical protein
MGSIMTTENQPITLPELPERIPHNAETSLDVPQASAEFRTVPNDADEFGTVPQNAERKENHTLTVRETARVFEAAGVARTERSIINWCQPNRQGIARLDSYFDPNERKYYITPQSVEAVIQEEVQRASKNADATISEAFGSAVQHVKHPGNTSVVDERKLQDLERQIMDLKIANRGKDFLIGELNKERKSFFDQLLTTSRTVGQLETKLNQLDGPELWRK